MESCEVVMSSPAMPCSQNLLPSFVGSSITSDSTVSLVASRARSRSQSQADMVTVNAVPVSASQDIAADAESSSGAVQSASHYITTRSATGRLAKRPKRDHSPPLSPPRKIVKEGTVPVPAETTPQQVHHRKQWSPKLKNLFFEGLFEHGKDFDAIQNLFVQKHKKLGDSETPMKTKDQIRHFYYRTWHKMSGYIDRSGVEDANKQALEVFGLICYNELRRKSGAKLDEKMGQRLNELVYKGSTTVKFRGKNCRVKIPTCRALKRLINVDEMKEKEESRLKLPDYIVVELRPRTKAAWARVQALSKNPRLLVRLPSDRRLSYVIDLLRQKWQTDCKESNVSEEASVSQLELTLCVPCGCNLSPISFRPIQAQSKIDLSFGSYLASFKNQSSSSGVNISPQNKRSAAKSLALAKQDDSAFGTKSKCAGSSSVDSRQSNTASGMSTVDVTEMISEESVKFFSDLLGTSDPSRTVSSLSSTAHVDSTENSKTEESTVVSDCRIDSTDPASAVVNISPLNPPTDISAEKMERLKTPFNRAAAQTYTIAELYLLMSRPEHIPLEYDWCRQLSAGDATDENTKQISMRLRSLVDVAAAMFALTKFQTNVGENGTASIINPTVGAVGRMTDFTRSPRSRNDVTAISKHIGRSPMSTGKARRDGIMMGNLAEASQDQSANYSWPAVALDDVASVALAPCSASAAASDYHSIISPSTATSGESVIFRVPNSIPPRHHAGKASVTMMPTAFSERKIVDQNILQQEHADLLMPKGRSRKLSRNVRKSLAQRTLLPKSQTMTSSGQIVTLAVVPGDSCSSVVPNSPSFLTSLSSNARCAQTGSASDAACRPSVITMAPTEIRVRRIVPTPVAVPCNSTPEFTSDMMTICSRSLTDVVGSSQSIVSGGGLAAHRERTPSEQVISSTESNLSHFPNEITGVDAFLQEPLHAGSRLTASALSSSLLLGTDSNSMLDISMPEASEMSDKLLDIALANSNSSFPGLLDSNSMSANNRDKESLLSSGVVNNGTFSNVDKAFNGQINQIHHQSEESWLSSDVAMDLSLSSFLNDSPMKKTESSSVASHSLLGAVRVPASRIYSLAAYTSGICGENSRDVDASLQCMMNENSYDLVSKFAELINDTSSSSHDETTSGNALSLTMKSSTVPRSTTYS